MEGGKDADCIIEVWGFQQQGFLGTDSRNCFPARFTELSVLGAEEQRMHELYRFIDTQVQDASMNMAIDEAVHTHHLRGVVPPTLRVFRWEQPSISLGRFQSLEREIESERCQQLGVALVRRPTGGRAVYHRDEFTYSIVIGKRYGVPAGVVAAYTYLALGLLAALQDLGVRAELSDERVSKHPSVREEALALYREKTTPLHTFAPTASWEDVAAAFRSGFSTALRAEFAPGELSASEWELARQLVEEKYSKLEWRKEKVRLV